MALLSLSYPVVMCLTASHRYSCHGSPVWSRWYTCVWDYTGKSPPCSHTQSLCRSYGSAEHIHQHLEERTDKHMPSESSWLNNLRFIQLLRVEICCKLCELQSELSACSEYSRWHCGSSTVWTCAASQKFKLSLCQCLTPGKSPLPLKNSNSKTS